jgi:hypothetical protein
VHEQLDVLDRHPGLGERLDEHALDRLGGRGRRRQRLADRDDPVLAGEAQVGEGPPDVDADAVQRADPLTGALRAAQRRRRDPELWNSRDASVTVSDTVTGA